MKKTFLLLSLILCSCSQGNNSNSEINRNIEFEEIEICYSGLKYNWIYNGYTFFDSIKRISMEETFNRQLAKYGIDGNDLLAGSILKVQRYEDDENVYHFHTEEEVYLYEYLHCENNVINVEVSEYAKVIEVILCHDNGNTYLKSFDNENINFEMKPAQNNIHSYVNIVMNDFALAALDDVTVTLFEDLEDQTKLYCTYNSKGIVESEKSTTYQLSAAYLFDPRITNCN